MSKLSFSEWMKQVDREVIKRCGMSYMDLPDYCYRDAYDDGVSPSRCAARAIKAAKDY